METAEKAQEVPSHAPALDGKLDSWKEIAAYLKRSERTVRRWEGTEALPVHRHDHQKRASVYAYKGELDAWWRSRGARLKESEAPRHRAWLRTAALAVVPLAAAIAFLRFVWPGKTPEAPPRILPLTSFPGSERYPSFSPDGNRVAFCWDGEHGDNFDIYVQLVGGASPVRLTSDPAHEWGAAWSPDGRWIAFLRGISPGRAAILIVPPIPGPARKITEIVPLPELGRGPTYGSYLAWTPDSERLVATDKSSPNEPGGLVLVSVSTGEKRRLTRPPPEVGGDTAPAFSPQGRALAFVRLLGYPASEAYLLTLSSDLSPQGEAKKLASGMGRITSPVWIEDGQAVLFSDGELGRRGRSLWKKPVPGPGKPQPLPFSLEESTSFTVSGDGQRLAAARELRDPNIWRLDTSTGRCWQLPFISSTRLEQGPQFSPDGERITFESERSGSREIWLSRSDGSNPVQLTSFGRGFASTPRWSPDGTRIVFERDGDIYVINSDGGVQQRLTRQPSDESMPSWSRDGRWIYYCSNRSGSSQIWKESAPGMRSPPAMQPMQVTADGGLAGFESLDGRFVYYSKGQAWGPVSLWRVAAEGGPETRVLESLANWSAFAIADEGIYFIPKRDPVAGSTIEFFSFQSGKTTKVARIEKPVFLGLTAASDGRSILYVQNDHEESELVLLEVRNR
jgi:Tol biopolymer transport system component